MFPSLRTILHSYMRMQGIPPLEADAETLKGPCNPNACRPLLNCIDLYVTYLTIWEYESVTYILQEFFNYFSLSCDAPTLKNLQNSDSLDDIISQSLLTLHTA